MCPTINGTLAKGVVSYSGNSSGALLTSTQVSIQCKEGLVPVLGVNSSSCSSEGVWLPKALACDSKCRYYDQQPTGTEILIQLGDDT